MKRRGDVKASLDLIPVMNLFTILVPFLLMSAQFVGLAVIDAVVPVASPQPPPPVVGYPGPPLLLRVGEVGFVLQAGAGATELVIPCASDCGQPDTYDVDGLTAALCRYKDEHPAQDAVVLVPEAWVPYELIVLTMDAAREDQRASSHGRRQLFPSVVLAAGSD